MLLLVFSQSVLGNSEKTKKSLWEWDLRTLWLSAHVSSVKPQREELNQTLALLVSKVKRTPAIIVSLINNYDSYSFAQKWPWCCLEIEFGDTPQSRSLPQKKMAIYNSWTKTLFFLQQFGPERVCGVIKFQTDHRRIPEWRNMRDLSACALMHISAQVKRLTLGSGETVIYCCRIITGHDRRAESHF